MPLFGRRRAEADPVDPGLEAVVVASTDDDRADTLKTIARNQAALRQMLEPEETPICICWYSQRVRPDSLLVITNRRSIAMHKGHVMQELAHDEVAEVTSWTMTDADGILVRIEATKAQLDYRPDDPDRMLHIIQVEDVTPRVAEAIGAAINPLLRG